MGTFPGHPSPSFFLLPVTVLARRGGRRGVGSWGLSRAPGSPGKAQASLHFPQAKVHPWTAAPQQEGQARKATSQATLRATHWQRLLPRLSPSSKTPTSNRTPAQLAMAHRSLGHPSAGEGQGTGGPLGRTERWQGCGCSDIHTDEIAHSVCRGLTLCDAFPTHSSHEPPMLGAGTQIT